MRKLGFYLVLVSLLGFIGFGADASEFIKTIMFGDTLPDIDDSTYVVSDVITTSTEAAKGGYITGVEVFGVVANMTYQVIIGSNPIGTSAAVYDTFVLKTTTENLHPVISNIRADTVWFARTSNDTLSFMLRGDRLRFRENWR